MTAKKARVTVEPSVSEKSVNAGGSTVENNKNEVLSNSDEIEVIALVPNVSYKDNHSGDFYEWNNIGDVEYLTFETLQNMWRNNKGYFRNLILKPLDERVIQKFGLKNLYEKFDFLMDINNYGYKNIQQVIEAYNGMTNDQKYSVSTKLKYLVKTDQIIDYRVIQKLQDALEINLGI